MGTTQQAKIVGISFFLADKLPPPLADEAKAQGFKPDDGLVAVKTLIGSPPSYAFESIEATPKEIKAFIGRLSVEDGVEIDKALKGAFSGRT